LAEPSEHWKVNSLGLSQRLDLSDNGDPVTRIVSPNNSILEALDTDTRGSLSLVRVELRAREVLHQPGMPVLNAYFPLGGLVSIVSTMESGATAEVALVGREGLVGLAGVLGGVENPTTAIVQIPGMALKTTTGLLKAARLRFPAVRVVLDRYTRARLIQVAQTAACNSLHSVEARLARWLLAADDRLERHTITLPQELIAQTLGVQRPTVCTAMHRIQESGAIAHRGRAIVIADRSRLERLACECYRVLRREFHRLDEPAVSVIDMWSPTKVAPSVRTEGESATALESMRQIAGRLLLANIREQEAREEAEAANRAKDQFLAMVSHELRNPLNAILGWCAMLNRPGHGSIEHGLRVIERNATAQLKLVEDLLDAVRLASSTLAIQPAAVDLGGIVQDAVDTAKPMADEKHVMLRLAIVDELTLHADADRLRQVFVNVVTNAVKFTDDGGSVDVAVTSADQAAHVTVRDSGRGIAPEALPHVFERFRQGAPPASGPHGLGLGLTIAQAVVELHGGRIHMASSGEGLGATCTIDLPLTATHHAS
jgi:signal transduction histidine kinase